jgi:trk system potassium uptake protein
MRPTQQLVVGFAIYCLVGWALLMLPWSSRQPATGIDHLFSSVSAVSTTGLSTVTVPDVYSGFGQVVLLVLFQVGGIGFMTVSSMLLLARGRPLEPTRLGILRSGFSLPHYFNLPAFLKQVAIFTVACEGIGAAILYWRFAAADVPAPLWSAVFHSVSAFSTAGFSLNADSLEKFRDDWVVNVTIGALCYAGAIGFIVVQDVWYSIRLRERMLTLTSKTILLLTVVLFVLGTLLIYWCSPAMRQEGVVDGLRLAAFQAMSASSTAGFNSVPIGAMTPAALFVVIVLMLVGASPAGTGGGLKTTSVSAMLANLYSIVRGRQNIAWLGYEVPLPRVLMAFGSATIYLILLAAGTLGLLVVETQAFLPLLFEAASAIGTVGLSMGISSGLSDAGKLIVIGLMFIGRCGPLTIGLALVMPRKEAGLKPDDLAV